MNFEVVLFILLVVAGFFWICDRLYFRKFREAGEDRPAFLEYTAGFFPIILIVFVIRSFLFEPFNIPSGSMIPTLRIGDLILVNKFEYGIKLPIIDYKLVSINKPARGDVAVFRWPRDVSLDYIKRVVGLPGDTIQYKEKQLKVNGVLVTKSRTVDYLDPSTFKVSQQFEENFQDTRYTVLNDIGVVDFYFDEKIFKNHCNRIVNGISCVVPEKHYFVLGDNRDNSSDSRYWGFVPEGNLVGKAVLIWFNIYDILDGHFGRLGSIN